MKKPAKRTTTKSRQEAVAVSRGYGKSSSTRQAAEPRPATKRWAARPTPWVDPLPPAERMERNRKAAALLRQWMADDSRYDEEMWPVLEQALKEDPIRFREDA